MITPKWPIKLPRVAWSFLDQGVVSIGNFLLNLVLARVLAPSAYGVFAIFYLAILGANTFHSSVVTYWLNLFGAKADAQSIRKLMTGALAITTAWLLPMSSLILIACLITHELALWVPATVALYCWQLQESARRALLCRMRYESSVLPDALSYLGQAGLVAFLRPTNLTLVFWIIAVTSVAGLLWQVAIVGMRALRPAELKSYLRDSLTFGRYVVVANGINVLVLQIPAWTLIRSAGQDGVAAFQVLTNVINASNPLLLGVSNHIIPAVARVADQGIAAARRVALRDGSLAGAVLLTYLLALLADPEWVMSIIYGHGSKYLHFSYLLRFLVIGCIFQFLGTVIGAYEGGLGRTASYMKSQAVGLAFLCIAGIPVIYYFGLFGAVFTSVLAAFVRAAAVGAISYSEDRASKPIAGAINANISNQPLPADV